jgi:hypothetical protein
LFADVIFLFGYLGHYSHSCCKELLTYGKGLWLCFCITCHCLSLFDIICPCLATLCQCLALFNNIWHCLINVCSGACDDFDDQSGSSDVIGAAFYGILPNPLAGP